MDIRLYPRRILVVSWSGHLAGPTVVRPWCDRSVTDRNTD